MSYDTTTNLADGDGLEIAKPEDFGIVRDEDGDIVPVAQRIPGTNKAVKVKPLVEGAAERWEEVLEEDNADDDKTDRFLKEHVIEGIGSDGLENCPDYLVWPIVEAVKNSSGYEVFQELQEKQQAQQMKMFEQMENIPEDLLLKVMDMNKDEAQEIQQNNSELHNTIGSQTDS